MSRHADAFLQFPLGCRDVGRAVDCDNRLQLPARWWLSPSGRSGAWGFPREGRQGIVSVHPAGGCCSLKLPAALSHGACKLGATPRLGAAGFVVVIDSRSRTPQRVEWGHEKRQEPGKNPDRAVDGGRRQGMRVRGLLGGEMRWLRQLQVTACDDPKLSRGNVPIDRRLLISLSAEPSDRLEARDDMIAGAGCRRAGGRGESLRLTAGGDDGGDGGWSWRFVSSSSAQHKSDGGARAQAQSGSSS
ncbi:hypothetical protein F5X68DRAFT_61884 [Plectosphaerella plurivora]|uniref:Uncharacterized protein n=1 Tax=Plectosphaerella plurivora TaxID=936078 RepID=A0A9P8V1S9_9PEZI|nr:hypothetical protein F5X68DRAFT_61884 [Plectosphaerella plurivora]